MVAESRRPLARVTMGHATSRQMHAADARQGAQKSVPKLTGPRRALHWQKARRSVQKPCAEMTGLHIPGRRWAGPAGPCTAGQRHWQGNEALALYVRCRSASLLLRGMLDSGPLPSGSPEKQRRIRIGPVKVNGQFRARFRLHNFDITFRQVSGVSGVQPAWMLGLR